MKKLIAVIVILSAGLASCGDRSGQQRKQDDVPVRQEIASAAVDSDSVMLVKGTLVIGHEVRTFTVSGDTVEYWIVDKSGRLTEEYYMLTGISPEPYIPVYAELEVKNKGKSDDGFAAGYAGVYEVMEIVRVALPEE